MEVLKKFLVDWSIFIVQTFFLAGAIYITLGSFLNLAGLKGFFDAISLAATICLTQETFKFFSKIRKTVEQDDESKV